MWFVLISAGWAGVTVALPAGTAMEGWREAAKRAGVDLVEGSAQVEIVATPTVWLLSVSATTRKSTVGVPASATDREAVLALAASLIEPLPTLGRSGPPPKPPTQRPPAPREAQPRPRTAEEKATVEPVASHSDVTPLPAQVDSAAPREVAEVPAKPADGSEAAPTSPPTPPTTAEKLAVGGTPESGAGIAGGLTTRMDGTFSGLLVGRGEVRWPKGPVVGIQIAWLPASDLPEPIADGSVQSARIEALVGSSGALYGVGGLGVGYSSFSAEKTPVGSAIFPTLVGAGGLREHLGARVVAFQEVWIHVDAVQTKLAVNEKVLAELSPVSLGLVAGVRFGGR